MAVIPCSERPHGQLSSFVKTLRRPTRHGAPTVQPQCRDTTQSWTAPTTLPSVREPTDFVDELCASYHRDGSLHNGLPALQDDHRDCGGSRGYDPDSNDKARGPRCGPGGRRRGTWEIRLN